MADGRVLRRLGAVVVALPVVALALHEVGDADEMAHEVHRNVVGDLHLDAEIQRADGAVLGQQEFVLPLVGGQFGAGLADGVERAELGEHPVLFGGEFHQFDGEVAFLFHTYSSFPGAPRRSR